MTPKQAADILNGMEYADAEPKETFAVMKEHGLVAVFGASDDLMEFRGAIDDEVGAYSGTTELVTQDGLLVNKCDDERCPYFLQEQSRGVPIKAQWCPADHPQSPSWAYKTDIPHETFLVMEEGEVYCVGIVFALDGIHTRNLAQLTEESR